MRRRATAKSWLLKLSIATERMPNPTGQYWTKQCFHSSKDFIHFWDCRQRVSGMSTLESYCCTGVPFVWDRHAFCNPGPCKCGWHGIAIERGIAHVVLLVAQELAVAVHEMHLAMAPPLHIFQGIAIIHSCFAPSECRIALSFLSLGEVLQVSCLPEGIALHNVVLQR